MSKIKLNELKRFDMAQSLRNEEDIMIYLQIVMEENNPDEWANALDVVARARGMAQLAKETGIERSVLFSHPEKINPKAMRDAMVAVMQSLKAQTTAAEAH